MVLAVNKVAHKHLILLLILLDKYLCRNGILVYPFTFEAQTCGAKKRHTNGFKWPTRSLKAPVDRLFPCLSHSKTKKLTFF